MIERVLGWLFFLGILVGGLLLGWAVYWWLSSLLNYSNGSQPCYSSQDISYQCRKYQIEQCLKDERWDEATCIQIVGGGK